MANATVEKLKNFGLRFGDKIAVVLAMALFFACLANAFTRPTIEVQPDQIKKAAEQADSNLRRKVPTEEIVDSLVEQGIKGSDFAKEAEESSQMLLVAADFKPRREWVKPEPGAGLIRDQPELIAPVDLFAYPGRGGALVYELDSEGNRVLEDLTAKEPAKPKYSRSRRNRRGGGGSSSMGMAGMMGMDSGMGMGGAPRSPEEEKALKAQVERQRRQMAARLSGKDAPPSEDEPVTKQQGPPAKEITRGLRWVALTATLDHGQMLENYRKALKNPATAHPNYVRLDAQRQEKRDDGSWSDWGDVDAERNLDILDNLPMEDEELAPENVRPENLNDPLPLLLAGLWEKVHINSLVPKELKEIPDPTVNTGMMGMGSGMMGGSSAMGMEEMSMMGMGSGMMGGSSGMMMGSRSMGGMAGMMGMEEMGMMGMGMGMMGGGGAAETLANFWRSEEKTAAIRSLDFTAEPDATYRYRVRIVVYNPNLNREDVSPGVDVKSTHLEGPWSEPSDEVHMPPDVTAYAMGVLPASAKSEMKGVFQVVKFNPSDGHIIPRNFEAAPGEIVGDPRTAPIPTSDGTGATNKSVDFTSHMIVLDVTGGFKPLPSDFPGNVIAQPAATLLLRPDGAVELREEADDRPDEVRRDVESNYKREIEESNKVRDSSMGSGYGGMMDGMMGGMGSGMMGPGMMGSGRRNR